MTFFHNKGSLFKPKFRLKNNFLETNSNLAYNKVRHFYNKVRLFHNKLRLFHNRGSLFKTKFRLRNCFLETNSNLARLSSQVEDKKISSDLLIFYSVFQGFRQAKSSNVGLILSSSQFLILPQLPQKIRLASKVVKVDSKIIILLPKI